MTPPVWSQALMYAGFAVWAGAQVADWFLTDLWIRRRVYWITWATGSSLCASAGSFRGWADAAIMFVGAWVVGLVIAVRWTPFLKIRGRIIAADYDDRRAETPPTAAIPTLPAAIRDGSGPTMWWTLVAVAAAACVLRLAAGWSLGAIAATGLLTVVLGFIGLDDGRHRFPLARRQHLQAALVVGLSLPLFAIPAIAYCGAYQRGKKLPRSAGKHDAEAMYYHGHCTDAQDS
jgi:hypothetical protein